MIQPYTQQLEQIISEMNTALSSGQTHITNAEYEQWIEFLKQVYPNSHLLNPTVTQTVVSPGTTDQVLKKIPIPTLRQYIDIREIMMLAETNDYPTWFIQPYFIGLMLTVSYERGELHTVQYADSGHLVPLELRPVPDIPTKIPEYTGVVHGVLYMSKEAYEASGAIDRETAQVAAFQTYLSENTANLKFNALDIDTDMSFLEKAALLTRYGFTTPEYVLFPTSRLSTISSSKLETFFQSYITKAQSNGFLVDGLVIFSDRPLTAGDAETSSTHIIFKPNSDST